MLVSIGKAAQVLGVCIKTLRRWEEKGLMIPYRTLGNHRRYDLDALFLFLDTMEYTPKTTHSTNKAAVYARVSSAKQKGDLSRQIQYLTDIAKRSYHDVLTYVDVGSGLNDRRQGLMRLIKDALNHKFNSLYITYIDRLARFGTAPLLELFEHLSIQVHVLHTPEDIDAQQILVNDVIALVTSFSGKVHRMRRGKNKTPEMST